MCFLGKATGLGEPQMHTFSNSILPSALLIAVGESLPCDIVRSLSTDRLQTTPLGTVTALPISHDILLDCPAERREIFQKTPNFERDVTSSPSVAQYSNHLPLTLIQISPTTSIYLSILNMDVIVFKYNAQDFYFECNHRHPICQPQVPLLCSYLPRTTCPIRHCS